MTTEPSRASKSEELIHRLRQLRERYDRLAVSDRGAVAVLRRCKSADEVVLDGTFWRLSRDLVQEPFKWAKGASRAVFLFPWAPHRTEERFSFGRFLRTRLGEEDGAKLRFRRLLASRDEDELDHRMRGVLRLACGNGRSDAGSHIDWGVFGADFLRIFREKNFVRRRWAEDFYGKLKETTSGPDERPMGEDS